MATTPRPSARLERTIDYPTSDGRPLGETDLHRQEMMDVISTIQAHFAADPLVYVSGNLLLYYERGNKRKHVSPDVFMVRGVPKHPPRDYYLLWEEGKGPDVVIEITSKSTRREDQHQKWLLYRDLLRVPEYFQFDPTRDYLEPSLQGHRWIEGEYRPIEAVAGRLPSEVLGLHLERDAAELRLFDPVTGHRLLTAEEKVRAAEDRAFEAWIRERDARLREAEAQRIAEENAREADLARLREAEAQRIAEENAREADLARLCEAESRRIAEENAREADLARLREHEAQRLAEDTRRQNASMASENDQLRSELQELRRRMSGS